MLVVAVDTSVLLSSLGWIQTADREAVAPVEAFAEYTAPARPGHAETLLGRLTDVLSSADHKVEEIDLLVFGRGPGTFTGLRIGLSTVKGLGLAHGIPVKGISSLEALALSIRVPGLVATLIDARRGELFGALFEVTIENGWPVARTMLAEWVGPSHDVISKLNKENEDAEIRLVGNGISEYRQVIIDSLGSRAVVMPEQCWVASAFWMARVGQKRFIEEGPDDIDTIEPNYLREPDARLPGKKNEEPH